MSLREIPIEHKILEAIFKYGTTNGIFKKCQKICLEYSNSKYKIIKLEETLNEVEEKLKEFNKFGKMYDTYILIEEYNKNQILKELSKESKKFEKIELKLNNIKLSQPIQATLSKKKEEMAKELGVYGKDWI